jgi:hypothetical protein
MVQLFLEQQLQSETGERICNGRVVSALQASMKNEGNSPVTANPNENDLRTEAWRRFRLAFPVGSVEAFERAWPALRDGILIERRRRNEGVPAAKAA